MKQFLLTEVKPLAEKALNYEELYEKGEITESEYKELLTHLGRIDKLKELTTNMLLQKNFQIALQATIGAVQQ